MIPNRANRSFATDAERAGEEIMLKQERPERPRSGICN
jgi:hypothetical protein